MTEARARSARRILLTLACAGLMTTAGCSVGNTTDNSNTNNGNCNAAGGTNSVGCSSVASASAAATASSATSSPATTPPAATSTPLASASAPAGKTWTETTFSGSKTFANFMDAGNPQGAALSPGQAVQVSCRVEGFAVADGDKWWYRIAPSPWNGRYYASTDNFYNTPKPTGNPDNGVIVDKRVSLC